MPKPSKPSRSSSVMQDNMKHSAKVNLAELIAQHTKIDSPTPSTPRLSRKRDAIISSDLSDVEFVDSPSPLTRRRLVTLPPDSDSPKSAVMSGYSNSDIVDGSPSNVVDSSTPSKMRPKRNITKTAKAKALEESTPMRFTKPAVDHTSSKHKNLNELISSPCVDISDISDISDPPSPSQLIKSQSYTQKQTSDKGTDLGDENFNYKVETSYITKRNMDKHDGSEHVKSEASQEIKDEPVMLSPCPDPLLEPLYDGLPKLQQLCVVKSWNGNPDWLSTSFTEKCEYYTEDTVNLIIRAITFTRCNHYVNTARIQPSQLTIENSRLRVKDLKTMAVGIMTGCVSESFLVEPAEAGPRHNPYFVHKITIAPFYQDFRRDTSVWGLLFGFHVIVGPVSINGFSFSSRGEGKGDNWLSSSASSSPVKGKTSALRLVSSPLVAKNLNPEIASLSYSEPVPVYDGRVTDSYDGFGFTYDDFRNLSSLPLYRGGSTEVPQQSVVSVGYTLSTYGSGPVLSANVMFVILLSLA